MLGPGIDARCAVPAVGAAKRCGERDRDSEFDDGLGRIYLRLGGGTDDPALPTVGLFI
jgi:hypothetical protein